MDSEEEAFQSHLDLHPDDHTCRLIFADWLEERGDSRAKGMRALGELRKQPHYYVRLSTKFWWYWVCGESKCQELPSDWWHLMYNEMGMRNLGGDERTRRRVDDAAALAFALLSPQRQEELLCVLAVATE